MKTLFLIPARGGSKGIPKKNIKLLAGKPLICYAIDAARQVAADTDICISTDSAEIKDLVENYNLPVPFLRPYEIASDMATSESVIRHALAFYKTLGIEYERVVLLQPTSPLRNGSHIKEALALFKEDYDMLVSVKETDSNPYYVLFEENEEHYLKKSKEGAFTRRQDCPKVYEFNGAIYVVNVNSLLSKGMGNFDKIAKYEMPKLNSIDIDDEMDWLMAEYLLTKV